MWGLDEVGIPSSLVGVGVMPGLLDLILRLLRISAEMYLINVV